MQKIEHLVILMMENRSFDHYLGSLSLLEGRADIEGLREDLPQITDANGDPAPRWALDGIYSAYLDAPHGPGAQVASSNGGRNDGFVQQYQSEIARQNADMTHYPATRPDIPVGYYTRKTLPVLYALADQFTVCDHWFCSVLSSTWPNRKYLLSGKRDEDNDTQELPPYPGFNTVPFLNVLEDAVDPETGRPLTWKSYSSDLPFLGFWYPFAANHISKNFTTIDAFARDCREDTLPTISIVDPPFKLADDHPSHDVRLGQKFIGLIVDALTNSESWEKSALVILYDENGGFYDHVPSPPSFDPHSIDGPLGFRVPSLVISPYAKQKHVSKTIYDHTSILKSISMRWGIEFDPAVFGNRWANAPDIWSDCFDFDQAPLPMGTYTHPAGTQAPFHDLNWEDGIKELLANGPGTLEALLERVFVLPELSALDGRANMYDRLNTFESSVAALKRLL